MSATLEYLPVCQVSLWYLLPVAAVSDLWHLGDGSPHTKLPPCVTPSGTPSVSHKYCKAFSVNIIKLFLQESAFLVYVIRSL